MKKPPALSKNVEMQSGNKAELIKCIETPATAIPPNVSGAVLERSVLVNMGKPSKCQTFKDFPRFSSEIFCSQVKKHRQDSSAERIDVVFDTYKHESSKAAMRCKRGKGVRRNVQHNNVVPNNWRGEKKSELFCDLSNQIATAGLIGQTLICAFDDTCFSNNPDIHLTSMVP